MTEVDFMSEYHTDSLMGGEHPSFLFNPFYFILKVSIRKYSNQDQNRTLPRIQRANNQCFISFPDAKLLKNHPEYILVEVDVAGDGG